MRARGAAQCRLLPAEHLDDLPAGIGEDCPLVVVGLGRIETPRLSAAWVVAGFIVRGAVLDLAIQDARRNNGGANARRGVSPVCGGCVRPRCGDFLDRDWVAGAILRLKYQPAGALFGPRWHIERRPLPPRDRGYSLHSETTAISLEQDVCRDNV